MTYDANPDRSASPLAQRFQGWGQLYSHCFLTPPLVLEQLSPTVLWNLPPSWENRLAIHLEILWGKTESENILVYVGTDPLTLFQVWTKGILDWKPSKSVSVCSYITLKSIVNSEVCFTVKIPSILRARKRERLNLHCGAEEVNRSLPWRSGSGGSWLIDRN